MKGRRGTLSVRPMAVLGLLLAIVLLLFLPSSALALTHPFLETFGSANQPSFTKPEGLAVDQSSGDLLVIDGEANTISRWHSDGTPAEFSVLGSNVIDGEGTGDGGAGGLSFGSPGEVQIAVDNSGGATDGDIYVPQASAKVVDVFASTGEFLGQLTESSEGAFVEPCGVAVDPSGNLYVGDFSGHIHKYEPSANPPVNGDSSANFEFASQCTLAAGGGPTAGSIFPVEYIGFGGEGHVLKLDSATGEEHYVVDLSSNTTDTVNPASGHVYNASGGEVKEYDASGAAEATLLSSITPGGAKVTGIAVDEATGNVYVARSGRSSIEVWGPAVLVPDATTEVASVINGNVTLHGAVSAAGGPAATCVFEYVEIHAKGFEGATSVPCTPAGPFTGASPVSVSAEITRPPEASYRFRLLASNENGSNGGQALLFSTFETIPGLPDDRTYELISPFQKTGEVIPPEPGFSLGGTCFECLPGVNGQIMPMQSAPDGESVLYEGQPFSGGLAAGPNEYISNRVPSGWGTESLSSPLTTGVYEAFSPDLSRSVLYQVEPTLSPEAPTRGSSSESFANLYLRGEHSSLQPLVTQEPPNRDPGPPVQFGNQFRVRYAGGNVGTASDPAFTHLIFEANDVLTKEVPGIAPDAPEVEAGEECTFAGANCDLYEWANGHLRLVNVLPDNASAATGAVFGSGLLLNELDRGPVVDHAISVDGSRIFWSAEETGQVYVRIDGKETLEVPGSGGCKESVPLGERVCFLTASADGSAVLLSNGHIYEINEAGSAYESISDLTEGQGGFRGILGASEDFSRIYFVDTAPLTGGEENGNDEHAEAGSFNLYAWSESGTTFIGALLETDNIVGLQRYGVWKASRSDRLAQVSSDGSYLAFMSKAPLTGYDNIVSGGGECKGNEGAACSEVFEYSAASGSLTCASCNPTGQRPLGSSNLSLIRPGVPSQPRGYAPFPPPGNLSVGSGGRLFFESQDTLSARDINGHIQDVYEWEPNGVGSCKRAGGCAFLVSSGQSNKDSMFLDSNPTGNDAFFITRQQLVPADRDQQLDLYDARVGGGIEESATAPCSGEGCAGSIASPPAQPGAGSREFSGPVNPPRRHKRKHKKKRHNKHHKRSAKLQLGGSK